ncbi:Winged helix-turn-helix DNA-binding [Paenibacillus sp. yr247]|uniref:winged helix-turn-helix domain-containing protein n=1 Tax=Paenibacillus sp. yr247 TaxID=1761880 RepID=UPI000887BD58|nr:winged helix-turn-helix domain-containing protein [Paenibacillus sp. yr247]SDN81984.1 Winged helix-turn-helix DNA-binding [Paenibacillus sp. yr247]
MSEKSYFTIALDVKNSSDKKLISQKLEHISKKMNSRLKTLNHYAHIPFKVRMGDEIIAVFPSFSEGYDAYNELYNMLNKDLFGYEEKKLAAYIGVGFGFLDDENELDLHKINGSSLTSAFKARDYFLKNNKGYSRQYNQYNKYITTFFYSLDEGLPFEVVNHLISYINEICEKRTDKQKEVINLIELNPEISHLEIAKRVGTTENGVYKILQRSNYQLVKDAQFSLKKLLSFMQENYKKGDQ